MMQEHRKAPDQAATELRYKSWGHAYEVAISLADRERAVFRVAYLGYDRS
jgi:hypothetical protein